MKLVKIKQRDITDCGAACLAAISQYYDLKIPISKIRQIAGTDTKGTNALGMIQAAEELGFSAKGVRGKIDSLSKIPMPAIAHIIINSTLHHYVVIYSVKKNNIRYMDPADGKIHKLNINEFQKLWTGVLILLVPGNDFTIRDDTVSNIKRFFFLIKPHKYTIIQCIVGASIYTVLGLSMSFYIEKITDYVLVGGNKNLLNLMSIVMLCILIIQVILGSMQTYFMLSTGQQIDARLILGYYKHLMKLPQRFFDTMRVGEIISRINDAVKIRAFINDVSISIIVNLFIVIFSFILMFFYSWKLALILLIIIPIYITIYFIVNKLNRKFERKVMEDSAELESQLVESINSIRTIKQFGIENYTSLKTENKFIKFLYTVFISGTNSIFSSQSSFFINTLFTIIVLWTGSYFVLDNEITPGVLFSFYAIIGYFTGPIGKLIDSNKTIQNALIAADRLFEIMDLEIEDNNSKISFSDKNIGDIKFSNVSFSYGTRTNVFKDFNLHIPEGKITAIIGESGSGKTTISALIQKIYTIQSGNIYIGDQDLMNFTNDSIRKHIVPIPQQVDLFKGSIIENIALGDLNPDVESIINISKKLNILGFIEKLPNGFLSQVGENGVGLSGGQKQRIAIARALYKKPKVLIMDEATSSLDSESENAVQETIKDYNNENNTVIIIAHRLSTIMSADKIIVLGNGKLLEEGTHVELFKEGTVYHTLWKKQLPL